jgi:hypothetical protein
MAGWTIIYSAVKSGLGLAEKMDGSKACLQLKALAGMKADLSVAWSTAEMAS